MTFGPAAPPGRFVAFVVVLEHELEILHPVAVCDVASPYVTLHCIALRCILIHCVGLHSGTLR